MKLLTKGLLERFAKVGRQEETADPIVVAKFFNPTGAGTWYATEYDPEEKYSLDMSQFLGIGTTNGVRFHSRSSKAIEENLDSGSSGISISMKERSAKWYQVLNINNLPDRGAQTPRIGL